MCVWVRVCEAHNRVCVRVCVCVCVCVCTLCVKPITNSVFLFVAHSGAERRWWDSALQVVGPLLCVVTGFTV